MKIKSPTILTTISIIFMFIVSISEFLRTWKPRKLVYPLIMAYYFIGIPVIEKFIHNETLITGFVVLGLFITMIFIYIDLTISNKEKSSLT